MRTSKTLRDVYIAYCASRQFRPSTEADMLSVFKNHILPHFTGKKVVDIIPRDILTFQTKLRKELSPATVNKVIKNLRLVLADCLLNGEIDSNPCDRIKALKEKTGENNTFTREEIELILANMPEYVRGFFEFLALSGARPNEAIALKWDMVDFDAGLIHIRRGSFRNKVFDELKTESSKRDIPMVGRLKDLLLRQQKFSSGEIVFTNSQNKLLEPKYHYYKAIEAAGLRKRPMYQFRHSFATWLIENNVPINYVAKLLGHATIDTTIKRYVKPCKDTNSEKLEALLS